MPDYIFVKTNDEYAAAAKLFAAYAAWLAVDLAFQHFDEELKQLKTVYNDADGGIILCKEKELYAGCVAVRKINTETAELKRMFVQPGQQHKGIGQKLLEEAIALAAGRGYKFIRLDTLSHMTPAINLYRKNGFYEIPAYYHNPIESAVYFEKKI